MARSRASWSRRCCRRWCNPSGDPHESEDATPRAEEDCCIDEGCEAGWAVVYENGKPASVIIDIRKFQRILDRLDDLDDIEYLERLRKKPRSFRPFEEYLAEREGK